MTPLAAEGRVLGIDVGYSPRKKTNCFCAMEWTQTTVTFAFGSATSDPCERASALASLRLVGKVHAVAIDGPLTNGLGIVDHYRAAEALLSRGGLQKRGKPGQTSSPVGRQLHRHATALAHLALESTDVVPATHAQPIHASAVVEAFPNMYLGALVPEPELPVLHRDASDRYWEILAERTSRLESLIYRALPGRVLRNDLVTIRDHEHRAGVVCALTALSVAAGAYVAVGDATDGDIVLPAQSEWGPASSGRGSWLERELRSNLELVTKARRCHPNHQRARILNMN
ncbi:MAG: hypothetical protein AB7H93_16010 [Vicinamibacterales bacterium]